MHWQVYQRYIDSLNDRTMRENLENIQPMYVDTRHLLPQLLFKHRTAFWSVTKASYNRIHTSTICQITRTPSPEDIFPKLLGLRDAIFRTKIPETTPQSRCILFPPILSHPDAFRPSYSCVVIISGVNIESVVPRSWFRVVGKVVFFVTVSD